eukprot:m.268933 g.268933  ORF g.268933 m.268933 type:complete len:456 (-) comp16257_c0_seq2:3816-5183(-)
MASFEDLPPELVQYIFMFLNLGDENLLGTLVQVCKSWIEILSTLNETMAVGKVFVDLCGQGKMIELKCLSKNFDIAGKYLASDDYVLPRERFLGIGHYGISPAMLRAYPYEPLSKTSSSKRNASFSLALACSCANGYLEVAQWLTTTFRLTRDEARPSYALTKSCEKGHLRVAKWLTAAFNLGPDDARSDENCAFRRSCEFGHLAVAQWLTTTFKLGAHDAKAENVYALTKSCENGHLNIAQWLTTNFDLTTDVIEADGQYDSSYGSKWKVTVPSFCRSYLRTYYKALELSCANGHLKVAQWLVYNFHLSDVGVSLIQAFTRSCANGHLAVAQWLTDSFNLTVDVARSESNYALNGSCVNGHLEVAQWLTTTFNLTEQDARNAYILALIRSREPVHLKVVEWLTTTFNLVPDYRITDNTDIDLVMTHANVSLSQAIMALWKNSDDIVNAIMALTM